MPENKDVPQDVQRIKEKAERGETLTIEEAATLGGEGLSLEELGVERTKD